MVRRSLLVAAAAVVLSLLLHFLLLDVAARDTRNEEEAPPPPPSSSTTFDELVESEPEPVEPEQTEPMEKPEVTDPDPVEDTTPTSNVQVESDNPQTETTPGTGTSQTGDPGAAQSAEPEQAEQTERAAQQPVSPDATTDAEEPAGDPEAPETADAPETPDATPEEVQAPDTPQVTLEATDEAPDIPAVPSDETVQSTAVTRSLRPPQQRPSTEALQAPGASPPPGTADGAQRPRIQSSGLELLAQEGNLSAASGSAFGNMSATGNAEAANYAGRVLTHLNRTARMATSERGSARVQFQIEADGSLAWVRVLGSSGSAGIDQAAVAQVRKSAPFPAPPEGTTRQMVFVYHGN